MAGYLRRLYRSRHGSRRLAFVRAQRQRPQTASCDASHHVKNMLAPGAAGAKGYRRGSLWLHRQWHCVVVQDHVYANGPAAWDVALAESVTGSAELARTSAPTR